MCTDLPIHYSLNPRTFWCRQISVDYWSTDGVCLYWNLSDASIFWHYCKIHRYYTLSNLSGSLLCIMFFMYETVIKNSYSIVFSYHITINKKEPVGTLKSHKTPSPLVLNIIHCLIHATDPDHFDSVHFPNGLQCNRWHNTSLKS